MVQAAPDMDGPRGEPSWGSRLMQLLVVLLICALVRVWLVGHTEVIARNGAVYIALGKSWLVDPGRTVSQSPQHMGYPVAIAGFYRVITALGAPAGRPGWELAGQLVSVVSGMAAMVAIWWFAGMTFNWRIAWISALLFGVGRKWGALGSDVLGEPLSVCLQMWAAVLGIWALGKLRGSSRWAVLLAAGAGLCAGAGYLVRPEALLILAPVLVLWAAHGIRSRKSWGLTLSVIGVAIFSALLCALPYMIAIGGFTRRNIFNDFGALLRAQDIVVAEAGCLSAGQYMVMRQLVNKLFEAMGPIVAVLACIWAATYIGLRWLKLRLPQRVRGAFRNPNLPGALMMLGMVLLLVPLVAGHYVALGFLSYRYVMILAALLSPLAGVGGIILSEWIVVFAQRLRLKLRTEWVIFPGAAALLVGSLLQTLQPLHEGKGYYRQAAQSLRSSVGPTDVVLTDSHWILHYAEVHGTVLEERRGDMATDEFLSRVLRTRATHLVLSDRTVAEANRALQSLLRVPAFVQIARFVQPRRNRPDTIRLFRTVAPLFDERDYLEHNPDVRDAVSDGTFTCGFHHYVLYGSSERRNPSRYFDEGYYLAHNPDVVDAVKSGACGSGLEHYLRSGASELRNPSPRFDEQYYLSRYPDVREAVRRGVHRCGLEHYLLYGESEGRKPIP